ncbi:MAG: hypothetical protein WBL23_09600, partial [Salinisphaera sp.]
GVGLALLPGRIGHLYPGALQYSRVRREQRVAQTLGLCYLASRADDEAIVALEAAARGATAELTPA